MSYPVSLKEFYSTHNGVNTLLVKKNNRREVPPPIFNPCSGATDTVRLDLQYRGSDWGAGISYAVEVNGEIYNEDFWDGWFHRYEDDWEEAFEFSVGGYRFSTIMGEGNTSGTLQVLPHSNDDYIKVKLIPDPDMENNRLLGVTGGGVVDYDMATTAAEFCLKPQKKPPINCIGAQDRFRFGTQPLGSTFAMVESPSGLTELIYNVTMDGTDYGVVDFMQTPNPMFGNVGLSFSELPGGYGECILKLQGGVIGESHRFQLTSVPERGGNNIYEVYTDDFDEMGGAPQIPTVEHDYDTRNVEFCFIAMSRCALAPDYLSFQHYDYDVDGSPDYGTLFPLVYDVTLNGTRYGVTDFVVGEEGPYLTTLGEYTIAYELGRWGGGTLGLIAGPVGVPAHIVLEPVDAVRSNINNPDMNRTVEYDHDTKRVEFCLTRHECSGASENLIINMQKLYDDEGDAFTDFYYAVEVDGITINADHSKNLLVWDGNSDYFGDGPDPLELSVGSDSYNSKVDVSVVNNRRGGIVKIKLTPPGNTPPSNFIGVDNISNPTVKVDENGVITACLLIYQPR